MEDPIKTKKTKSDRNKSYYSLHADKVKAHMAEKIECTDCGKMISRSTKPKHKNSCYPLANREELLAKLRK